MCLSPNGTKHKCWLLIKEITWLQICIMSLKIIFIKLLAYFPRANDLIREMLFLIKMLKNKTSLVALRLMINQHRCRWVTTIMILKPYDTTRSQWVWRIILWFIFCLLWLQSLRSISIFFQIFWVILILPQTWVYIMNCFIKRQPSTTNITYPNNRAHCSQILIKWLTTLQGIICKNNFSTGL